MTAQFTRKYQRFAKDLLRFYSATGVRTLYITHGTDYMTHDTDEKAAPVPLLQACS
jgi:hypothetical protein